MDNEKNISDMIKALQIIKAECSKYSTCSNCSFYSSDRCNIKYTDPEYWELEGFQMIDYEDMILAKQELVEIWEDEPDSALCPIGFCWWDDIPEEDFICQYT